MVKSPYSTANERVDELEKLLVSIDWTNITHSSSLLSPRRGTAINEALNRVFDDKTLQQFLYDTERLKSLSHRLQPLAMIASLRPDLLDTKPQILLQKLLSHQAYSTKELWPLAVASLVETDHFLSNLPDGKIDATALQWYRMFVIDHAVSRMYTSSMALPLGDDVEETLRVKVEEKRRQLISQFELMVPEELKVTEWSAGIAETDDSAPFVLRAAHYYGHRGNDHLDGLQKLSWTTEERDVSFSKVPGFAANALHAYKLAISNRLLAYAKSFGTSAMPDLPTSDLEKISTIAPWETNRKTECEGFLLRSQALADIAIQYAAISCVCCYRYVYEVRENDGDAATTASMVRDAFTKATHYWRRANKNGTRDGEKYRTLARKRISEHMAYLVLNGSLGYPLSYYDKKPDERDAPILSSFLEMYTIATTKKKI